MRMRPCSECGSVSTKGGEVPSQTAQSVSWIREQLGMMKLGAPDTSHRLNLLPGAVTLKARITVTVLAKTVETASVNTSPNVVSCRMQVAVLGRPMKSKEQRKQKVREVSRM